MRRRRLNPVYSLLLLGKQEAVDHARFVAAVLGLETTEDEDQASHVDLIVALGGDGTVLRAARLGRYHTPVVGVSCGTLNFLAAFDLRDLDKCLKLARDGSLQTEERMRARVEYGPGEPRTAMINNDVVLKHGASPRLLQLAVRVDGNLVGKFRADGVIVSTPMGSTAYSLAAGGPILAPNTNAMVITPLCPHSVSHRPVVVPGSSEVSVSLIGPADVGPASLTADGQVVVSDAGPGFGFSVRASMNPLRIVPSQASVFEVMRAKLGWNAGE